MIYKDRIYGKIKIDEPVLLELIKSPSFQRLKGIDQAGYSEKFFPGTSQTRFEHSMGVFILLRKFGAPLKEQIAGLIHDVSHATFSHCIDYALDEGSPKEHSHQDNIFREFVKNSEIPKILKKYGFSFDYILEEKNFPLKEKALPDLCADRLDYSLRTAFCFKELKQADITGFLANLLIEDNNWVFKNFESGKNYAELFLKLNSLYYASFSSAIIFGTVGEFLRHALTRGYINKKDLYTTDKKVFKKAKKYLKKDKKLALLWARMNNKLKAHNNPKKFDLHTFVKSRIVDPLFKNSNGRTMRLSDYFKKWKKVIKKESIPKEYFIKFENGYL